MTLFQPSVLSTAESLQEPVRLQQAGVGLLLFLFVAGVAIWALVYWVKNATRPGDARENYGGPRTPQPSPPQRQQTAAPSRTSQPVPMLARWVPPGQTVTVGGYSIPGGMIYVGESLAAVSEKGQEPALIHPSLAVDCRSPNRAGNGIDYWPSYHALRADSRAAYLEWLAQGRTDPSINIGYVFLFFYGLERRLLHDLPRDISLWEELPAIRKEMERLRRVYHANGSFQKYSYGLLEMCQAMEYGPAKTQVEIPQGHERNSGVPLVAKIAMGRLVLKGKPIPAEWAWVWVWNDPETVLRTPAKRCPDKVRTSFLARFPKAFPDGLTIKPNKTQLVVRYRPASASFGGVEQKLPLGDIPDITARRVIAGQLRELLEQCITKLEAYSRWMARAEAGTPVLPGLALLPRAVLAQENHPEVHALRVWAEGQISGAESCLVSGAELLAFWPLANPAKPNRTEIIGFAQLLQKLDFGIEPDPRFEGPVLTPKNKVVIFRLKWPSPQAATPEYAAAALLLRLAASIAVSDQVAREEEELLQRHLEKSLNLTPPEKTRMAAHLHWLLSDPPGMTGLKKRIEQLGAEQRSQIADFLVAVAGADGKISKAEVTALSKAFAMLGVETGEVYSRIHVFTSGVMSAAEPPAMVEPVTVQESSPSPGFRIPAQPPKKDTQPEQFTLNMKLVEAKLAESIAVSTLLSEIFVEEEEVVQAPVSVATGASILGLDEAHSAALRELLGQPTWSRMDWERLCAQHGLMPDGAIETINEAVFEGHDAALIEGDDPIELNMDIAKEIEA